MRYDEDFEDDRESQKQKRKQRFKNKGRDRRRSDYAPGMAYDDVDDDESFDPDDWREDTDYEE